MSARRLGVLALIVLSATAVATTPVLAKGKADHKASPITLTSFPTALTKKQAVQVVLQYSRENDLANKKLSVDLQNKDEEGISAKMDDAAYHLVGLNQTSESYLTIPTTQDISVYLTNATKAPSEFLALVKEPAVTGANPVAASTEYLVFRKDTAQAPWRVLYEPYVTSSTSVPAVEVKKGLADIKSTPASQIDQASRNALPTLVRYLNTGVGGVLGSPKASLWNTGESIIRNSSGGSSDVSIKFTANSSPVDRIAAQGGNIEFGAINETNTYAVALNSGTSAKCVSIANGSLIQEFPTLIPDNVQYKSIGVNSISQVALFVPTNTHEPVQLLGYYAQIMSASLPRGTNCGG